MANKVRLVGAGPHRFARRMWAENLPGTRQRAGRSHFSADRRWRVRFADNTKYYNADEQRLHRRLEWRWFRMIGGDAGLGGDAMGC